MQHQPTGAFPAARSEAKPPLGRVYDVNGRRLWLHHQRVMTRNYLAHQDR